MELDFQRTHLERYEPAIDTVVSQEVTMESIVPDAFPDVSRVISTYGNAYITSKQTLPRGVSVKGSILLHVLYIPEGGSVPRSLSLELPFQCSSDFSQVTEKDTLHSQVISVGAETRLLNPRKLLAKAEVKLHLRCYAQRSMDIICGLKECSPHIQMQNASIKNHFIPVVVEKQFSFTDTLKQSAARPVMEEVLTYQIIPSGVDARYIGNKLICKGIMNLSGIYRSGNELQPMQFELPFSQIIEFQGALEDGEPDVSIVMKQLECTLREGELDVIVDAQIEAVVRTQQTVTLLSDLYSTAEFLDVERTPMSLCTCAERGCSRESVRKFCEAEIPAKQVIKCYAGLSPLNMNRCEDKTEYRTDALVSVLYKSEDDTLCSADYTIPVACSVELPENCSCICSCSPVIDVLAVPVTAGIEVRLDVDFNWLMTGTELIRCVSSVREGAVDASEIQLPSVMIRLVANGESLWEIAKTCHSTVEDICKANVLSSEEVPCGTMLLIPTKR